MPEPDWTAVDEALAYVDQHADSGSEDGPLLAAARWALEAHKRGRRVAWCETHESSGPDDSVWCYEGSFLDWVHTERNGPKPNPCRMVEHLLIPLDSEETR